MFMAPESALPELRAAHRGVADGGEPSGFFSFIPSTTYRGLLAALDAPAGVYNVAEPEPRRRSEHRDALASMVGRTELSLVPDLVDPGDDEGRRSLAKSHRISSRRLGDVTGWTPTIHAIDQWKGIT